MTANSLPKRCLLITFSNSIDTDLTDIISCLIWIQCVCCSNDIPEGIFLKKLILKKMTDTKLEDLKVLRRSPDLFNYVEIGQGQLQLIIKHILFYHIWGLQPFWSSDLILHQTAQ